MEKVGKKITFGEQIINFYRTLTFPHQLLLPEIEVIYPYYNPEILRYIQQFYHQFYSDTKDRVFVFGINPGRFGSGSTGIPFTDPISLEKYCRIPNTLAKKPELTSGFIYQVINELGSAKIFYESFFLTAVCPVGFTHKGKNYNYYDNPAFLVNIRPFIVETLTRQIDLGSNRKLAIVLGTGTNLKIFRGINEEFGFFEEIYALEHPRFILQYRRGDINRYLEKYKKIFSQHMIK